MKIVISSGHGKHVAGASGYIDEVTEARRVVPKAAEYMRQMGAVVTEYNEDTAKNKTDNLNTIIKFHNSCSRDFDVSIHFNAVEGLRDAGIGVETLYFDGNTQTKAIASRVSKAISKAGGLILRRGDGTLASTLGFMRLTNKPAILVEVCFVNSKADVDLYKKNFDAICRAIASAVIGSDGAQASGKTPEEITVDNAVADGIVSDRDYWLGVLRGTIQPKPEYVKIVLDRYREKSR
ncbi:MAG: N-acetylmuramoyl-L-alanine amidase [Oscillospiraceae bacterium]|nr:N-acetylmuramoyl-L-alanine amidase [Oscillospiraceae bacterium]